MSIESLDISRRLEECAKFHIKYAILWGNNKHSDENCQIASMHNQWAADIRSVIVPQPGERDDKC